MDPFAFSLASGMHRRQWLTRCLIATGAVASAAHCELLAAELAGQDPAGDNESPPYSAKMIRDAAWMSRVELSETQCEEIAKALSRKDRSMRALRATAIEENTPMAAVFQPSFFLPTVAEATVGQEQESSSTARAAFPLDFQLPAYDGVESAAFWGVRQLATGLRRGLFTSEQLTTMYLDRLKRFDPSLHCVVTYHGRALEEARAADAELRAGKDRGILHGIPWGAKDIIAIPGMPTTWGAAEYRDRERGPIATVADRMRQAGAVLLAKLSVGTLAWGDEWYREKTRNPWDPDQGSSGSSAGSASAAVAGLVGFALGSETLGSIVSPCRVCCVSGLRPSFGRVSRFGCMTLGWTMDKIGPIARFVEDCGWIFAWLIGTDGLDPTVVDRPYRWPIADWSPQGTRVGISSRARGQEKAVAELLADQGAEMVELDFEPEPRLAAMADAITIEAAAMHGALFASIQSDDEIGKWAPTFREAQFCSAIDYVQALRARVELVRRTEQALLGVDFLVGDGDLTRMNLTGHPSQVVAFGKQSERDRPNTVVLTARFFGESRLLAAGAWLQRQRPPLTAIPSLNAGQPEPTEPK